MFSGHIIKIMKKISYKILFLGALLLSVCLSVTPGYADKKKQKDKTTVSMTAAPRQDYLSKNDRARFQYFFLEAVRQQQIEHYAAAYDLLEHCRQIDPQSAVIYYMQAQYLSQLGRDSLALKNYEIAARLNPRNDSYQERLALYYIGAKNFDAAIKVYEQLAGNNRDRDDILNILVKLYQQNRDYDKMLDAINRIEQINGESEEIMLSKVQVYEMKGDKKNAYKVLKQMADAHPDDNMYSILLGNWEMQNGRQKDAYKIFSRVVDEEPDNTYALSSLYDYYRSVGNNAEAKAMSDRILLGKNTPSDSRVQFLKMAINENEGDGVDSMQTVALIDSVQQVAPKDSSVAELKVLYLLQKKMPQEMQDSALVQLLKITPDNAGARFQLIQNLWTRQDWKKIAALGANGMLYNPDQLVFYYFTGLARFYLEDDLGALNAFQHGTAQIHKNSNPDIVSDFYGIMGDIYSQREEKTKAFAAYDSCLAWKPDNALVLNNYAYYLSTTPGADLKRAEEMSAKSVKMEPKNGTFLDTYAWILYGQGRYTEAKIYIEQALANDTDSVTSAVVLEHAGDIWAKNGDLQKAREYWKQALANGGDKDKLTAKINGQVTNRPDTKATTRKQKTANKNKK